MQQIVLCVFGVTCVLCQGVVGCLCGLLSVNMYVKGVGGVFAFRWSVLV
jgi:phosphotransferase system  glucose/maltose/N-acetylglucosamine-specific IIC component